MTETDGRRWISKLLGVTGSFVQRIESGPVGLGIPDLWIKTWKVGAWGELKIVRLSDIIVIPWRPLQVTWLERNHVMGGTSILFAFYESRYKEQGVAIFKDKHIWREYTYEQFFGLANVSGMLDVFTPEILLEAIER